MDYLNVKDDSELVDMFMRYDLKVVRKWSTSLFVPADLPEVLKTRFPPRSPKPAELTNALAKALTKMRIAPVLNSGSYITSAWQKGELIKVVVPEEVKSTFKDNLPKPVVPEMSLQIGEVIVPVAPILPLRVEKKRIGIQHLASFISSFFWIEKDQVIELLSTGMVDYLKSATFMTRWQGVMDLKIAVEAMLKPALPMVRLTAFSWYDTIFDRLNKIELKEYYSIHYMICVKCLGWVQPKTGKLLSGLPTGTVAVVGTIPGDMENTESGKAMKEVMKMTGLIALWVKPIDQIHMPALTGKMDNSEPNKAVAQIMSWRRTFVSIALGPKSSLMSLTHGYEFLPGATRGECYTISRVAIVMWLLKQGRKVLITTDSFQDYGMIWHSVQLSTHLKESEKRNLGLHLPSHRFGTVLPEMVAAVQTMKWADIVVILNSTEFTDGGTVKVCTRFTEEMQKFTTDIFKEKKDYVYQGPIVGYPQEEKVWVWGNTDNLVGWRTSLPELCRLELDYSDGDSPSVLSCPLRSVLREKWPDYCLASATARVKVPFSPFASVTNSAGLVQQPTKKTEVFDITSAIPRTYESTLDLYEDEDDISQEDSEEGAYEGNIVTDFANDDEDSSEGGGGPETPPDPEIPPIPISPQPTGEKNQEAAPGVPCPITSSVPKEGIIVTEQPVGHYAKKKKKQSLKKSENDDSSYNGGGGIDLPSLTQTDESLNKKKKKYQAKKKVASPALGGTSLAGMDPDLAKSLFENT
jgi:hypothetical protein